VPIPTTPAAPSPPSPSAAAIKSDAFFPRFGINDVGSRIWMAFDTLAGLETGFFFRVGNINECDFFRNEKLQQVVIGVPLKICSCPDNDLCFDARQVAYLEFYFIRDCEEDQHDLLRESFHGGLPFNGSVYINYTGMMHYIDLHSNELDSPLFTCLDVLIPVIRTHFQNESGEETAQIVNKPA